MQDIAPQPKTSVSAGGHALHRIRPLVRSFCPSADATTQEPEHPRVCPVLLLLLPLFVMLIALATGSFFGFDAAADTLSRWYHVAATGIAADATSVPVLVGAGAVVLLLAVWLIARSITRHRAAHSH